MKKLTKYCLGDESSSATAEKSAVRSFLQVWISTTVIMWFYVVFSYVVFDFTLVGNLGLIYTIVHSLAPVVYKYSRSLILTGLCISITALLFQITFCVHNGGIQSASAIWFTAHPVIISFFASRFLVVFSVLLNIITVVALTFLGDAGLFPVDSLSNSLSQIMLITSLIGLDVVIATYTLVFIQKTTNHSNELLRQSNQVRELMKIISHDINNSLSISMNAAELFKRRYKKMGLPDEPKLAGYINNIQKANRQILDVSSSVKDWMKAKEGSFSLDIINVPVSVIIEYLADSFKGSMKAKSLEFVIDNQVENGVCILGDKRALQYQIFGNLLANSIKFSPRGRKIIFQILKVDRKIQLSVIDQGVGMSPEHIKTIFISGKTTSNLGTDGERGTGFGLPIVKNLIDLMSGSITVTSVEVGDELRPSGTTVTVQLPIA